jgi:hypothetical protein
VKAESRAKDTASSGQERDEGGTGEGELLGVGVAKLHIGEALGVGMFLSDAEHFRDEVRGDNAAVGTDGLCECEGRFTGATGEVEDVEAGRKVGALEDEAGGGARLERELVKPLLPEGSGFEPFLTDEHFGVGNGCGVGAQMSPPARGPRDG